jgi:hypothetical protein
MPKLKNLNPLTKTFSTAPVVSDNLITRSILSFDKTLSAIQVHTLYLENNEIGEAMQQLPVEQYPHINKKNKIIFFSTCRSFVFF